MKGTLLPTLMMVELNYESVNTFVSMIILQTHTAVLVCRSGCNLSWLLSTTASASALEDASGSGQSHS